VRKRWCTASGALRPTLGLVLSVALLFSASCGRKHEGRSGEQLASAGAGRIPALIIAVPWEPDHLLPPLARSAGAAALWPWIYPSLVRVETDSLTKGRFVPDLATGWQLDDDRKGIRFRLDSTRLWDDTTSVVPADVITSYRLFRDPAVSGGWARRLDEILSVEEPASAPGTILFRFRRSLSLARALQLASLPVISSSQWAQNAGRRPGIGEPGRIPRNAGPFLVEDWKPGESIRLARHPFAVPGRVPAADRILLRVAPLGRSRGIQVEEGSADVAIDLPVEEVKRLRETGKADLRLVRAGPVEVEALVWNLDHPIWGQWGLRRELIRSLNRERLRQAAAGGGEEDDTVLPATGIIEMDERGGLGKPSTSPGGSASPGGPGNPILAPVRDDSVMPAVRGDSVTVALPGDSTTPAVHGDTATPAGPGDAAMAQAPGDSAPRASFAAYGNPALEILYDVADPRRERIAIELALQIEGLGLPFRLVPAPVDECILRTESRGFDVFVTGFTVPAIPDVGEVWGSGGAYNYSGLRAGGVDSLIAVARSAAADTIPDIWARVERKAETQIPFLPVDRRIRIDLVGPGVVGYRPDPALPFGDLLRMRRDVE
jgi:ABC-type transport system substrate-binding protein